MASLIKNQVLKHLTKFFKDLAPEQLQLSAFKGSCELSNLQLEEKVLMDLVSFPAWLRINKAVCDQLSIKIPWTKIKSVPIQMNLNEVTVEVEVCEDFRDIADDDSEISNHLANLIPAQAPGKYGFVDRVIDGITVTVNNILIIFKSKLMSATFNLSRVLIESRCPNWKQGELSLTKIKDTKRGQILLFKVIDWQTMRLEAKCLTDPNQAPLRLITNHAQCRLTIKKNLDDCSVVAARIFVIFEDILWVLTFAQFVSAASFVEYVFSLVKRSPISKKTQLLQDNQSATSSLSGNTSTMNSSFNVANFSSSTLAGAQSAASTLMSPLHSNKTGDKATILSGNLSSASLSEQKFLCYDLVETSLHLYIDQVDAHLYDDIETKPSSGSLRDSGGALQTTFDQIQVDCYPYSRANSDRKHWYKWFDPSPSSRRQWIKSHFANYELSKASKSKSDRVDETANHSGEGNIANTSNKDNVILPSENLGAHTGRTQEVLISDQLLSLTVLVKIKDYCMNCVATRHSSRAAGLDKFIQTDKDYHMPSEMPALYLELDYFYYFDAINRMMVYDNVPNPLAFMHLSPTKLLFDSPTLVFLNSFHVNLTNAFVHLNDLFPQETSAPNIHCRVEILMPQVILPAKKSQSDKPVAPDAATSCLLVKSGKITLCNSIYDKNVLSKLMSSIEKLKETPCQPINLSGGGGGGIQSSSSRRENTCSDDWTRVWNSSLIGGTGYELNKQTQLWSVQFEPIWMDFMNYDVDQLASGQRLEPIVEPVSAYAFIHLDLSSTSASSNETSSLNHTKKRDVISVMFTVLDGAILANMDKVQFGFLQRLGMHAEKLIQQIREDASSIIRLDTVVEDTLEINLTAYIKEIKARLILDKKIEFPQSANESVATVGQANASILSTLDIPVLGSTDHKPLSPSLPSNPSSLSYKVQNSTAHSYIDSLPSAGDPFASRERTKCDGYLSDAGYSSQLATIIDSADLDNCDELDECVEVADDASCLILGERSISASIDISVNQEPTTTDSAGQTTALNIDNPQSESQTVDPFSRSGSSGSNERANATAGSGTSVPLSRSVGKSPIEESLLINLDEIEQSSQLFAKMDVAKQSETEQPSAPLKSEQPSEPLKSEQPDAKSGDVKSNKSFSPRQQQQQQQDIETESISYLELSMSQLMVRRITETKRRQKF